MEVKQNETEQSSEIDPHTYGQMMSYIGYKNTNHERNSSFVKS